MQKVNNLVYTFLWKGKKAKIKKVTLIGERSQGGFKAPDFNAMDMSLKALWVRRLRDKRDASWKIIPNHNMEKFGGDILFHTRIELKDQDLFDSMPPFYCEVLKNWQTIKDTTQKIDTRATIEKELMWKNRHIKVGNKSIFIKKWHEKGINYVEDVLNEKNEFLSHESFQQKFNIQTPYTTYFGVIDAFPKRWKKLLREPVNTCDSVVTISKWMEDTSRLTNKILYSEIIKKQICPSNVAENAA